MIHFYNSTQTFCCVSFLQQLQPLSVLAAIVISGVVGLLDYEEAIYLWKVHKFDFGVWLIACVGTMLLGVEIGLAIAVGVWYSVCPEKVHQMSSQVWRAIINANVSCFFTACIAGQ